MIKRRIARLVLLAGLLLAVLASCWEYSASASAQWSKSPSFGQQMGNAIYGDSVNHLTAVDPCPGDLARASQDLNNFYYYRDTGNAPLRDYWWNKYTQDWNTGHAHHCW